MAQFAASSGVAAVYTVAIVAVFFGPVVVTALKGQWLLFVAGWLTLGMVWVIACLRLARPGSWWARHLYGPEKLARAEARYGGGASEPEPVAQP